MNKLMCTIGIHRFDKFLWRRRCKHCTKVQEFVDDFGGQETWRNLYDGDVKLSVIKLLRKLKVI